MVIDSLVPGAGSLNTQGHELTAALVNNLQQGMPPEQLLDSLTAAYPNLDDTALQNELARLILLSELVGRVEARQELAVRMPQTSKPYSACSLKLPSSI